MATAALDPPDAGWGAEGAPANATRATCCTCAARARPPRRGLTGFSALPGSVHRNTGIEAAIHCPSSRHRSDATSTGTSRPGTPAHPVCFQRLLRLNRERPRLHPSNAQSSAPRLSSAGKSPLRQPALPSPPPARAPRSSDRSRTLSLRHARGSAACSDTQALLDRTTMASGFGEAAVWSRTHCARSRMP